MKKTFLFAVIMMASLSLAVISCNNDEINPDLLLEENINQVANVKRSYDEALTIAKNSISMLDSPTTRSGRQRTVDTSDSHYILSPATRADGSADTLLYVFNFADNAGFAVVSANASATGLLAVTEEGNFNELTLKQNQGLSLFMEMAKVYSVNERGGLIPFCDTISVSNNYINPLISVIWGQGFPTGLYFPNTIAGCTNAAMTLVASYFEYPTQLQLTFPQKDTTNIMLDWTDMKSHIRGAISYNTETMLCLASVEAHKNIGRLCRQIAHLNSSTFILCGDIIPSNTPLSYNYYSYIEGGLGNASTSASTNAMKNTFNSLNYTTSSSINYSSSAIRYYLNYHRPIIMIGYGIIDGETVGHVWVVDGYTDQECQIFTHATQPPSIIETHKHYNHINWGWDGHSNGYFYDGVFTANAANSYDYSYYHVPYSFPNNIVQFSVYR